MHMVAAVRLGLFLPFCWGWGLGQGPLCPGRPQPLAAVGLAPRCLSGPPPRVVGAFGVRVGLLVGCSPLPGSLGLVSTGSFRYIEAGVLFACL